MLFFIKFKTGFVSYLIGIEFKQLSFFGNKHIITLMTITAIHALTVD